jgi:MerR family transcriptional activator of bmr gene
MDKQNLLTIGNLSKQTGVHVKSLRYYEQLGILLPAYTDPDTGYRYYTLSQIPVVDAIRTCIFLDIPLKEFTGFLTKDQQRIHYKKLFSHGTMLAHRKIREIQEKLRLLEKFRKQMDREEGLLLHGEQAIHALPEKYCWVAPYAGKQHTPDFNILITRIFDDIDRRRLRLGAEAGLLSFHRKAGTEQFLYVEVEATGRDARQMKEIMRLPAASFLCAVRQESGIAEAPGVFPGLFAQEYNKIIMETELFSGDYDVANPKFELRCSLPPGGK